MKREQPTFVQGVLVGIVVATVVLGATLYATSRWGGTTVLAAPAPIVRLPKAPAYQKPPYLESLQFVETLNTDDGVVVEYTFTYQNVSGRYNINFYDQYKQFIGFGTGELVNGPCASDTVVLTGTPADAYVYFP